MIDCADLSPTVRLAVEQLETVPEQLRQVMLRQEAVEHIHAALMMARVDQWGQVVELLALASGFVTAGERMGESE